MKVARLAPHPGPPHRGEGEGGIVGAGLGGAAAGRDVGFLRVWGRDGLLVGLGNRNAGGHGLWFGACSGKQGPT